MSISNHPVEQEELMAYLDGELAADRAAETASHLEQCADCQRLAADLREVSDMLMAWQVEEAEREPATSVVEAFEKRVSQKTPPPAALTWRELMNPMRWPKPVWGLAGACLVAVVLLTPALLRTRFADEVRTPTAEPSVQDYIRTGPPVPLSAPTPRFGVGSIGKLQNDEGAEENREEQETSNMPAVNGPMIIRTAELEVRTEQFDKARAGVEEILKRHHGYIGELNVSTPTGSARALHGTLRVPASQLDATLANLKGLGRAEKESQGGEEVTQQYVDLEARLANSKHTEQRLTDILRQRTGKLSDVLAVEMQISRVRGEIEQMEAERKTMKNQVDFATLTLTVNEAYKAELKAVPPSTGTQFRNAAVEGYRSLVDGIIAVLLWLLSVGPTLLLWAAILFFPVRMAWRRLRPRFAK